MSHSVLLIQQITYVFFQDCFDLKFSFFRIKGEVHLISSHSKNKGLNNMNAHGLKRIFLKCHLQQK